MWIADNRAQRDQHERGAKHKAAVAKLLNEIAEKNKEKARVEAETRAQVAEIEARAAGSVDGHSHALTSAASVQLDRAQLLEQIASATGARGERPIQYPNAEAVGKDAELGLSEPKVATSLQDTSAQHVPERDSRGYGQWVQVEESDAPDPGDAAEEKHEYKNAHTERPIGARDAHDEDEAAAHARYQQNSRTELTSAADESGTIAFKSRGISKRSKQKRARG